jgi:hypothetical protein
MLMVMVLFLKNGYLTPGIRANVRTKMGCKLALVLLREVFSTPTTQGIDKVIPVDVYRLPSKTGNRRWRNEITKLVRTDVRRRSSPEYQDLWHLIISNNIMALENTVIQDKLTAAFGEMCFIQARKKISFI